MQFLCLFNEQLATWGEGPVVIWWWVRTKIPALAMCTLSLRLLDKVVPSVKEKFEVGKSNNNNSPFNRSIVTVSIMFCHGHFVIEAYKQWNFNKCCGSQDTFNQKKQMTKRLWCFLNPLLLWPKRWFLPFWLHNQRNVFILLHCGQKFWSSVETMMKRKFVCSKPSRE